MINDPGNEINKTLCLGQSKVRPPDQIGLDETTCYTLLRNAGQKTTHVKHNIFLLKNTVSGQASLGMRAL